MTGFRRKPPLSCLLIICQPSGWHNYPEVCEAVRPKQSEGAQCKMQDRRKSALAFGHPAFRAPSCEPSPHPKGMQLWVHVRCCAPLRGPCAVDAPKKAHLWAQRSGLRRPRFFRSRHGSAMPGAAGRAGIRTFDTPERRAAVAGRQRHGAGGLSRLLRDRMRTRGQNPRLQPQGRPRGRRNRLAGGCTGMGEGAGQTLEPD